MNRKYLIICICAIFAWSASAFSLVSAQGGHEGHGTHAAGKEGRVFQAQLQVPDAISAGKPFTIAVHIRDDQGQGVAAFDVFQEKLMHLILVSDDLGFFAHLHPEHKGNGRFLTETVLPHPGSYTLFSDYKPTGHDEQVSVLKLLAQGQKKSSKAQDGGITEKIVGDIKVGMHVSPKTVRVNDDVSITFDLKRAADNSPVRGLQPYLGEKGHLVIIKKSALLSAGDYIHAHAAKDGEASEIRFMTRFPDPGVYRLWCQFNWEGRIMTADFRVTVER